MEQLRHDHLTIQTAHTKTISVFRRCEDCHHAYFSHKDGTCDGWPSDPDGPNKGEGRDFTNLHGQTLKSEPCTCSKVHGFHVQDILLIPENHDE